MVGAYARFSFAFLMVLTNLFCLFLVVCLCFKSMHNFSVCCIFLV